MHTHTQTRKSLHFTLPYSYVDNSYYLLTGILSFHCLEHSGKGGESRFVDGFCVAERIRQTNPKYLTLLSKVTIPFEVDYADAFFRARKSFFQTNQEGEVIKVNFNDWDRRPLDAQSIDEMQSALGCDTDEAVGTYYKALHCLHDLMYGDKFTYEIKLLPGMLLVFNNQRMIHGRRELTGHRTLCGSQINCEDWESTLRLLEKANSRVY